MSVLSLKPSLLGVRAPRADRAHGAPAATVPTAQIVSQAATPTEASTDSPTLADLGRGGRARVLAVEGAHPAIARRLFDLGFAPGAEVEMLRRAPMADPVVYRVAGYDIALRRAEAGCVRVEHAA